MKWERHGTQDVNKQQHQREQKFVTRKSKEMGIEKTLKKHIIYFQKIHKGGDEVVKNQRRRGRGWKKECKQTCKSKQWYLTYNSNT